MPSQFLTLFADMPMPSRVAVIALLAICVVLFIGSALMALREARERAEGERLQRMSDEWVAQRRQGKAALFEQSRRNRPERSLRNPGGGTAA